VPPQVPNKFEPLLGELQGSTKAISKGTGLVMLLNIFSGASLQKVWKALNILQFTIYVNDWKLAPPTNIKFVIEKIQYFCRGDWLPKAQIMEMFH